VTIPDWFEDHMRRTLEEVNALRLLPDGTPEGTTVDYDTTPVTARKLSAWVPTTCCAMTDATGENHCNHTPPPRPPWHRRTRWAISSWWSRLRLRLGSWIAGVDLDERDEW
jgi:hypothetical protein